MAATPGFQEISSPSENSQDRGPISSCVPDFKIPYLPWEILSLVAESLPKRCLKSLRLASKRVESVAVPYLFDTIYVSNHLKDLEVFQNITSQP